MKTTLYYDGNHMTKGEYEVSSKIAADLLKTGVWSTKGEAPKESVKPLSQEDKLKKKFGKTVEDLRKKNMKDLRVWAEKNGFKSKDTDKEELIAEMLNEL